MGRLVQRNIIRIKGDKVAEAEALFKEHYKVTKKHGITPSLRVLRPLFHANDILHILVFEMEWESMDAFAQAYESMISDPDRNKQIPFLQDYLESVERELFELVEFESQG